MVPHHQFIYFLAADSFEQKWQSHSKLKVRAQSMSFYKTLMQKSSLNQHQVETTSYALKISVRSTQLAGLMSHDRNLKFWGPNCWCWESRNGPTWSPSHIGKGYWGQILPLFRLLELQNSACRKCQFWGICKLWGTKALFHSRPQLIHKGLYPGILQDFRCLKWKDQQ
jgi:hypothetical protein